MENNTLRLCSQQQKTNFKRYKFNSWRARKNCNYRKNWIRKDDISKFVMQIL